MRSWQTMQAHYPSGLNKINGSCAFIPKRKRAKPGTA
jgi:hypothetical protein